MHSNKLISTLALSLLLGLAATMAVQAAEIQKGGQGASKDLTLKPGPVKIPSGHKGDGGGKVVCLAIGCPKLGDGHRPGRKPHHDGNVRFPVKERAGSGKVIAY